MISTCGAPRSRIFQLPNSSSAPPKRKKASGGQAHARIGGVPVHELIATNLRLVGKRDLQELVDERLQLEVPLGLRHLLMLRKVERPGCPDVAKVPDCDCFVAGSTLLLLARRQWPEGSPPIVRPPVGQGGLQVAGDRYPSPVCATSRAGAAGAA